MGRTRPPRIGLLAGQGVGDADLAHFGSQAVEEPYLVAQLDHRGLRARERVPGGQRGLGVEEVARAPLGGQHVVVGIEEELSLVGCRWSSPWR